MYFIVGTIMGIVDILEIAGVEHICACTHHGYFPNLKSITVDCMVILFHIYF